MDPYRILGVSRDASDEEIKKAYRTLSKKYHPDANVDSPHQAEFTEMFKKVQNAYDQIMDQRKNGGMGGNFWQNNQGYQQQNTYSSGNTDYQAAANYLNNGYYQEAYNILQRIQERDANWYYLAAVALWGLKNQIAAVENIKKACEMDPSNQQYRMLLQQMQSGRMNYQNMQSPFGAPVDCGQSFCCRLMLLNMLCGGCFGGRICC